MAEVEILIKGYYNAEKKGGRVCATISLVKDGDSMIIVDPGTLPDPGMLIAELARRNLTPDQISMVVVTHAHMDHCRHVGMFPRARVLDFWGLWQDDLWTVAGGAVSPSLSLLETPGHSDDSVTLLVKTDMGNVALCGDVFWSQDYPVEDPFASDVELLNRSRDIVLEAADFIVPGHGDMFRVIK